MRGFWDIIMNTYGGAEKECPIPDSLGASLWRLMAISFLFFLAYVVRFIFAPLMPTIEKDLDITHAQAGSFFLMISVGMFISQCLSGYPNITDQSSGVLICFHPWDGCAVAVAVYRFGVIIVIRCYVHCWFGCRTSHAFCHT